MEMKMSDVQLYPTPEYMEAFSRSEENGTDVREEIRRLRDNPQLSVRYGIVDEEQQVEAVMARWPQWRSPQQGKYLDEIIKGIKETMRKAVAEAMAAAPTKTTTEMPIKVPIPRSEELLDRIMEVLTPNRLPLLIAIDGADLSGKSSLASWLAWQLGMPAVQLDLYLTTGGTIKWRTEELARVIAKRIDAQRPIIVEGVLIFDALDQIRRKADFLIFVAGGHLESSLAPQIAAYLSRQKPLERADFKIDGYRD